MAFRSGYLANCTVFLDLNQNELLDSGEPFAATSSSGAYTIALPQVRNASRLVWGQYKCKHCIPSRRLQLAAA